MGGRAPAEGHRIPFEPALDGLRGIGMLATLCFHAEYRVKTRVVSRPAHCKDRETAWPDALRAGKPDVVIFTAAPWDVSDRRLPGDDQFRAI